MSSTEAATDLRTYFPTEVVTGYGLMKGTSKALQDLGIDKILPGPMGYTYLKKGYVTGEKNVKSCTRDEAVEWASKYIAKLVGSTPVPTVDPVAEAAQIMEEMDELDNE